MKSNTTGLILAGALAALVGCVSLPNSTSDLLSNGGAKLNIGFAGTGYSTLSLASTQSSNSDLTFDKIMFTPSKIEVHYAGAFSDSEKQTEPTDIKGQESDQSTVNTGEEPSESGEWIAFPVDNGATIDLTKLANGAVSFGEEPLKSGKYDQIRITGTGSYEGVDESSVVKTGDYTLPSGRLYISQGFEVRDGYMTDLKFAFDAKTAMVVNQTKVILKPSSVKVHATYTEIVATPSPEVSASPDASSSV